MTSLCPKEADPTSAFFIDALPLPAGRQTDEPGGCPDGHDSVIALCLNPGIRTRNPIPRGYVCA